MAVKVTMDAYKDLSETAFRTFGGLIVQLGSDQAARSLTCQRLPTADPWRARNRVGSQSRSWSASQLADGCDPALRNACAHSQYRWDKDSQTVHDMRSDQRWTLEEVQEREALLSEVSRRRGRWLQLPSRHESSDRRTAAMGRPRGEGSVAGCRDRDPALQRHRRHQHDRPGPYGRDRRR